MKFEQITIAITAIVALAVSTFMPLAGIALLVLLVAFQWARSQRQALKARKITQPVQDYRVPDSVMLINADGIILDCNHQVLPMFGYERSEVIGQAIEFLMAPSIQKHHVGLRNRFFMTSGQRRMQNRVWALHKDGHKVHIEVFLEISSIEQQSNVVCSIRDIGRFWQREQDLLAQNRLLESTHHIGFGIVQSTLGGTIVMANSYICRLLSYSQDECKTLPLSQIVHPDDSKILDAAYLQLLELGEAFFTENIRMRNAMGHYIWCRIQVNLVDQVDASQLFAWVIHDISTLKALQTNLDDKAFQFNALMKSLSAQQAVWIAKPGMTQMLEANQAFFDQWHLLDTNLQSYPKTFRQTIHPDDVARVNAVYDGHMRGQWQLQYRVVGKNGTDKTVSEKGVMVTSETGDSSVLICFQTFQEGHE